MQECVSSLLNMKKTEYRHISGKIINIQVEMLAQNNDGYSGETIVNLQDLQEPVGTTKENKHVHVLK